MNLRRATASVVAGTALALAAAAPANAASQQWIDWIFPAYGSNNGSTQYGPAGSFRAIVGISPSGYVVKLNVHITGVNQPALAWSQAYNNLCIFWNTPQTIGPVMQNPHSFAQRLRGYSDTDPTVC